MSLSPTMAYLESIFPGQALIPAVKAGACLGYASQTVRNKIQAGEFPVDNFLVGKKRLVRKIDLADYLDGLVAPKAKRGRGRPRKEAALSVGVAA